MSNLSRMDGYPWWVPALFAIPLAVVVLFAATSSSAVSPLTGFYTHWKENHILIEKRVIVQRIADDYAFCYIAIRGGSYSPAISCVER